MAIEIVSFPIIVTDMYLEHQFFPKFRNLLLEHQNYHI